MILTINYLDIISNDYRRVSKSYDLDNPDIVKVSECSDFWKIEFKNGGFVEFNRDCIVKVVLEP